MMNKLDPNIKIYSNLNNYNVKNCNNKKYTTNIFSGKKCLTQDVFDYSLDDGKISKKDKIKNFAKGVVSPITNMFSSPKNFAMGAGMIAIGGALMVATGGAIAPALITLGVAGGAVQFGVNAYKASKAATDEEAKIAWQGMGAGTSSVALSVAGSKASLKASGVDTSKMSYLQATVECFKQTPASVKSSVSAVTSAEALNNIKNIFVPKKDSIQAEAELRTQKENQIAEAQRQNNQAIHEMQNSSSTSSELQAHPELQNEYGGYSAEASAKFFEEQGLSEVEIQLNQKLDNFKTKIQSSELNFQDNEAAIRAYDNLLSQGINPDDLLVHANIDDAKYAKLEKHDLHISTISDTKKGKGIPGFHVKDGYDALFTEASQNSGKTNNAKGIIESFLADDSKGNFKHDTITVSKSPDFENSIVIDVKGCLKSQKNVSLIITRDADNIVRFQHIKPDGTIEQLGVKTIIDKSELEYIFAQFKEQGILASKGISKGKISGGYVFKHNGQYYHGQVTKQGELNSIFPISEEAAKQKNFILDLIPILK